MPFGLFSSISCITPETPPHLLLLLRGRFPHFFLLVNSSIHCHLSSARATSPLNTTPVGDRQIFFSLAVSLFVSPSPPNLHPWRQVVVLRLPFCIAASDGTSDALYWEADMAIPVWLQSGGHMDGACALCQGIRKIKKNPEIKPS